ncbi:hypothetical protein SUGI_0346490 [Cryptomeria japonica]|nr:hypothetical protein SUGI_0346490 [Cryptomeria japonica]
MARSRKGLNDIPDSLLCLILTKVPLEQAIRCSVLSQRWKLLWRYLPKLDFSEDFFFLSENQLDIQNIIDDILKLHSAPLELFQLHGLISSDFSSATINEWINHATLKDDIKLNDKTFELMLQLCPVLEILVLHNCNGIQRLKISSASLIILNLDFPPSYGKDRVKAITVKCSRFVSLTIKIRDHVEKMEFELPTCLHLWTNASPLEPFTTLKSLTKMTLVNGIYESVLSFLHQFPHLKQIFIDMLSNRERLKSSDAILHFPTPASSLENLQQVYLNITSLHEAGPLLTYLLLHAPALKTLIVSCQKGFDGALEFVNTLFKLPRASKEAKILLSLNNFVSEKPQL